jgi:hypothetical protein
MQRDSEVHRFFHKKESASDYLAERVNKLRKQISLKEPEQLAQCTGASCRTTEDGQVEFQLTVWGRQVFLFHPELIAYDQASREPLDIFTQALLAYYFHVSDGTPETRNWIAFTELPDGRFYDHAFQGYTGKQLSQVFGDDMEAFAAAATRSGGQAQFMGDQAYAFQVLPMVSLLVVCWLGDEDFLTSYRILFDVAVSHHLSTDACAVVGSTLTRRLLQAHN